MTVWFLPTLTANLTSIWNCTGMNEISGSVKLHIGDSWTSHNCPRINVSSVATHKCWNAAKDGWWGKMNQCKIQKKENLHLQYPLIFHFCRQYFFHNGQCWYSVSVDTRKMETQTLGGSVIGNFSVRSILKKWQTFFIFFIMADTDIPFLLTLGKPETQALGGSVIGNFSVWSILRNGSHFSIFS